MTRLSQRQRLARWQRERRQQAIVVTVFSGVLFFVLGLAAWAAAEKYYEANLTPAVRYAGELVPMREYEREREFQLVSFYVQYQVPPGFENDPQVEEQKGQYTRVALDQLIEQRALDLAAREEGVTIAQEAIDRRYVENFSQFSARHVLIEVDAAATDAAAADAAAKAKATEVATQLRAAPMDQQLWNTVAAAESKDPGSAQSGGELGFVGKGQFVKEFEAAALALEIGQISDPVKTDFGYHVIQVKERRGPQDSDIVKRYLVSGFTEADIKARIRFELLREEFARRTEGPLLVSPTDQVHLAKIVIAVPLPTSGSLDAFTEGLRKISEVTKGLEENKDFGELAKQYSSDPSAEQGGDIGWFARGMNTDLRAEEELFALPPNTNSRQYSVSSQTTFYRVLEKDPARALTPEQIEQIKATAFGYWLAQEKREHDAARLMPGQEID